MTSLLTFTPDGLVAWLTGLGVETRLLRPCVPMPTVPLAARAIGVDEQQILKTLLFRDRAGSLVRVIACGPSRIDLDALAQLESLDRPKLARPEIVLEATGWPAGGVAPVGSRIPLRTYVDRGVLDWPRVFGGGGTEDTLIDLAPADIIALNVAEVATLTGLS